MSSPLSSVTPSGREPSSTMRSLTTTSRSIQAEPESCPERILGACRELPPQVVGKRQVWQEEKQRPVAAQPGPGAEVAGAQRQDDAGVHPLPPFERRVESGPGILVEIVDEKQLGARRARRPQTTMRKSESGRRSRLRGPRTMIPADGPERQEPAEPRRVVLVGGQAESDVAADRLLGELHEVGVLEADRDGRAGQCREAGSPFRREWRGTQTIRRPEGTAAAGSMRSR